MKNFLKTLSVFLTLLAACGDGDRNIFWISEPDGQENDFLFMAESTNVAELESDSLIYYLSKKEIASTEKLVFKNFGTVYKNEKFKVVVLLKEGSDTGRDYTFLIRTFDNDFKMIDSYELATWIGSENRYCFGSIDKELIIKRSCQKEKEKDVRQIVSDGRIVAISYDGD